MKGWFKYKYIIGGFIFVVVLFFRLYNFEKGFLYAHDADLYSWIAKDIVGGHQRLVGQVTSVDGVFIGSFYYYIMAVFYKMFGMNPMGAVIPLTLIGLFDCWSIYFVFSRHFGKKVGIIGSIIWAVSWGIASFERWSVPTQPTMTWSICFLAVILELYKGNLKYLWLYGFLCGFTWQLHIALLPILPLPILAYLVGKNNIKNILCKEALLGILMLIISITPFAMFELKHNFSQIKAMSVGINKDWNGPKGWLKVEKVINASGKEFQVRLLEGYDQIKPEMLWMAVGFIIILILATKKESRKIYLLLCFWIFLILWAQYISKRVVSEYYFSNLIPVVVLFISLFMANFNKLFVAIVLMCYFGLNWWWMIKRSDLDLSYYYRNLLALEIKKDMVSNGYNCIALNYIAGPGVGVGFRYLMWYHGINIVKAGTNDVPIYNISIPWQLVEKENPIHYGRFGVLIPKKPKGASMEECRKKENQIDPLLGYTN